MIAALPSFLTCRDSVTSDEPAVWPFVCSTACRPAEAGSRTQARRLLRVTRPDRRRRFDVVSTVNNVVPILVGAAGGGVVNRFVDWLSRSPAGPATPCRRHRHSAASSASVL